MEGLEVSPNFWRDKRVFITGHTGFKGGWLSLWMQILGAKVFGYALPPSSDSGLFEVGKVLAGMDLSIFGDIRDLSSLREAMNAASPDIVFHLAAQPLVRESYLNPIDTYSINVMGVVNLFEAARDCSSIKAVVNVTTDKCYENKEWVWGYREDEPMGGFDPYSSSKGCSELITSAYRRSFLDAAGIRLASARAGNVIGGGDWSPDRLIPDILRSLWSAEPLDIRYPKSTRPWQHVLAPLSGYIGLAEKLYEPVSGVDYASAWNFGPSDDDVRTVEWVVNRMSAALGAPKWRLDGNNQFHEARALKLDSSKAAAQLNWRAHWDAGVAIQKTADWYLAFRDRADMRDFTISQIYEYSKGVSN